ncbi:Outer membrane protein assembly factor YaeT precursor [Paramagnetospirillum magnetotacticum MS-1]|uniref:Outer membrane protein assembly factor YaeT n=1 Tax=Paramagnetospirillum magnetotacticum MS-1 TaxID=272627 RepID=A0A0C2YKH0_PARME|nr:helix-turn-helix domain-containing protein [Paramagnetospirillum magnetotacticum]KIM00275.1 Outer membrane protein assembly factor YaeT precursor [Paramagnetospirillum magnetotacticum MS-1]
MDSTANDPQTETPAEAPVAEASEQAVTPEAAPEPAPAPQAAAEPGPQPVSEPVAEPQPLAEIAAAAPLAVSAGVGATLRSARDGMGKTLPECAKLLRIRQIYLEALEEGRHRDLPGGTYAAGFLRSYAEYLGLDSEEMVRRFREEGAGGFKNRTELTFPSPVSEGRIPGGAVIFLGLILAAVAYGGWYMLSSSETKVTEMVPPLPDRLAGVLNRQASLTGEAKTAAEASKPGEEAVKAKEDVVPPTEAEEDKPAAVNPAPAAPEPVKAEPPKVEAPKPEPVKAEPPKVEAPKPEPVKAEPPKVEAPKPEPVKAEPPKVEAPKPEPVKAEPPKVEAPKPEPVKAELPATSMADGKVYGTEYADARVVLKATGDDCWIQVREVDGSLLMSRLLRRGDSFRVPNRSGLNLMVGNAGSLEVSVDGRKVPALGAAGQVRRDIRLDPDKLATGG